MSQAHTLHRPYGQLDWDQDSGPRATEFGDVYFSAEDGLAEARAVFLNGCNVDSLFFSQPVTVIGELGFGTGLNFLAAWQRFNEVAAAHARLHFVSVEGFPLKRDDVQRALSAWPELSDLARQLIAGWPSPRLGPHRRIFDNGRVTLTVFHDEAEAALSNMQLSADAWFLDGFSPALNPDMWSEALFRQLACLSHKGTRAATFTVAGAVRRGLQAAGFEVSKHPGFGRKRERLEAVFTTDRAASSIKAGQDVSDRPVILGGGIAGASLTRAMQNRGIDPIVIADGGWAKGASGAPRGLLTPRLEAADRPHVRALINACEFARSAYESSSCFEATGVLRLADAESAQRWQSISDMMGPGYEFLADATERAAVSLPLPALWMEEAGHFDPGGLISWLVQDYPCQDRAVDRIERLGAGWSLISKTGETIVETDTLFMAGGADLIRFDNLTGLQTERTGGQLLVTDNSHDLSTPISGSSYVIPFDDDRLLIGATHEKSRLMPVEEVRRDLLQQTRDRLGVDLNEDHTIHTSWQGWRAAYNDRLPAYGRVPDESDLGYHPGLFILSGLGARGFAHAPLLAETLVSEWMEEPLALEKSAMTYLKADRFRSRALRRR